MNRRGFLAACLALAAAPAIVRASSLMPVVARRPGALAYSDQVLGHLVRGQPLPPRSLDLVLRSAAHDNPITAQGGRTILGYTDVVARIVLPRDAIAYDVSKRGVIRTPYITFPKMERDITVASVSIVDGDMVVYDIPIQCCDRIPMRLRGGEQLHTSFEVSIF